MSSRKLLTVLTAALLLSACATTVDTVTIESEPYASISPISLHDHDGMQAQADAECAARGLGSAKELTRDRSMSGLLQHTTTITYYCDVEPQSN